MGEAYEALDTKLDRKVAVEVLPERFAEDESFRARFEREAKALAALSHPNILAVYDFGNAEGVCYTVTELLEDETLRSLPVSGKTRDQERPSECRASRAPSPCFLSST